MCAWESHDAMPGRHCRLNKLNCKWYWVLRFLFRLISSFIIRNFDKNVVQNFDWKSNIFHAYLFILFTSEKCYWKIQNVITHLSPQKQLFTSCRIFSASPLFFCQLNQNNICHRKFLSRKRQDNIKTYSGHFTDDIVKGREESFSNMGLAPELQKK